MKSEQVTLAWEFYRDNCEGFKEPMRKELRKLDDYVASVEAENDRLRELVRDMYAVMVEDAANCDVTYPEQFDYRVLELGVEVER